ncbi:DUF3987 domain-containing protein [Aureimonas sp. OT7]|uniref:DUF3987 domain-containing protein n=1 Tax=Aureimonas sp. OT7 TaxID=2816454 RepID=UPI0017810B11|nr:DUF3987 domain-containing protein [Aureimonas sp. OT7]QOG06402.1 DUF3987 domain-containing protein [Aureimonas sp. OT7]
MGLDFDIRTWPQTLRKRVEAYPEQISGALSSVSVAISTAAALIRPSSSAGVCNRETGQKTDSNAGQHRFLIASEGHEIARAVTALHERLVLAGWGWPFVTQSGTVEIRSLIDRSASVAAERLWFEGRVQLSDPRLEFVPKGRTSTVRNPDGGVVDLCTIVDLSTDERERLQEVEQALREAASAEAREKRHAWKAVRRKELIARGVDPAKADKTLGLAVEQHILEDDFEILFDDGTGALVSEILADPMSFHRKTGPDPLEPDYGGGRNKAILYGDAVPVRIESQAHGGVRYLLRQVKAYFEEPADVEESKPAELTLSMTAVPLDIFSDADPKGVGELPPGSLPPFVERWARSEGRRKGVQTSFPAASAVAALAAAVGSSLRIKVRQHDDWSEPASLWVALIAPPGSAKTPVISAAASPLRQLDGEWIRADVPIHAEWLRASKKQRKDAAPLGPEPRIRRAVVDDVTSERLIGIFADNPHGLLRDTDELAGLFGSLGAYKKASDGDRSQLLRLFEGGSISRDRQTAGSSYAATALMGVLAGSQPERIKGLVRDLGEDGLLQRFLFVLHDGVERTGIDETPDREAARAYARTVRGLRSATYRFPEPIRLTPDAADAMKKAISRLDKLRHLPGAAAAFQDHVAKWGKIVPRLVLTFHAAIAFERDGRVNPEADIEAETVQMAERFAQFLMLNSIRFYETFFGASEVVSDARWVAGHLLTKPELVELTRRDIYDARKTLRGPDFRPLVSAMAELEAAGWLEVTRREADGPVRWKVNGTIHTRFADRAVRERQLRADRHEKIAAASSERRRLASGNLANEEAAPALASVFD